MQRAKKAFTLVELLVVIGIIAVLVAILLPTLSRARDHAMGIQCQSNLRQLHNAFVLYAGIFNNYCIPAQAADSSIGGSGVDDWWLGVNTLGKALGTKGNSSNAILDRLAKMLDCPSTKREKIPGRDFSFDYSYNANLGDIRGQFVGHGSYPTYKQAHQFKKWNQVPGNVLALAENSEPLQKDDERFDVLEELTWKKAHGGQPHRTRTKGNVLFHDGSVYMCRIYTTKSNPRALGTDPGVPKRNYTDLENWMIAHPGHAEPGSVNQQTREQCWQKGAALPKF